MSTWQIVTQSDTVLVVKAGCLDDCPSYLIDNASGTRYGFLTWSEKYKMATYSSRIPAERI